LSNIERNYRTLQSQYNWQPMSEKFEKFREKFPLQYDEKAGLIHRTERLNYIKSSQPKLAQEVRIPLKRYGSSVETRCIPEPAESFRFGQVCNKPVERPKAVIYTNEKGFARLVDPYVTTTMKDIVPHVRHQHDTVTFWNWTEREERKRAPKKPEALQPRLVVPVHKRKLNNGFTSEMQANY
ncbi:AGAP007861-PA, partial [Anopheles gambiae str. PEST]